MTHDEKIYDLAIALLADVKNATENDAARLADALQQAYEDFVGELEQEVEQGEQDTPETEAEQDESEVDPIKRDEDVN